MHNHDTDSELVIKKQKISEMKSLIMLNNGAPRDLVTRVLRCGDERTINVVGSSKKLYKTIRIFRIYFSIPLIFNLKHLKKVEILYLHSKKGNFTKLELKNYRNLPENENLVIFLIQHCKLYKITGCVYLEPFK